MQQLTADDGRHSLPDAADELAPLLEVGKGIAVDVLAAPVLAIVRVVADRRGLAVDDLVVRDVAAKLE